MLLLVSLMAVLISSLYLKRYILISSPDPSILIAMRSQVFPLTSSSPAPDQFPLDLGLSLDIEPDLVESYPTAQEDYMEESIIEICEVQLLFDGMVMSEH